MSIKRYDLIPCDGDSHRCYAHMDDTADGDWVLNEDHAAEIARLTAEVTTLRARCGRLRDLAADASSGMEYIQGAHGRLYGVGWDRVRDKRILCEQHNDLKEPTDG